MVQAYILIQTEVGKAATVAQAIREIERDALDLPDGLGDRGGLADLGLDEDVGLNHG